jgi:hypothetical protein
MANVRAAGWASGGPPPFVQFPTWLGKNSRRNKRARLLAELGLHMAAHTSGGRESVRLDYLTSMRARLFAPLVAASKSGGERVEPATAALRVAELLDEYGLSKVRREGGQTALQAGIRAGARKGVGPKHVCGCGARGVRRTQAPLTAGQRVCGDLQTETRVAGRSQTWRYAPSHRRLYFSGAERSFRRGRGCPTQAHEASYRGPPGGMQRS